MRIAVVPVVVLGLLSATAASAQERASDQQFLQASRCLGIAKGLGADPAPFKAFVKTHARSRADIVIYKGQAETGQAVRQAADPVRRDQLAAELSKACSAYLPTAPTAGAR
jgi:hypothetical protein